MKARYAALVLFAACTCGGEPDVEPASDAVRLASYFPTAPGDRWLFESSIGRAVTAVTGQQGDMAVIFGDGRTAPLRVVVRDDAVVEVDGEGREVARLLDAPLELNHAWTYGDEGQRCEAAYTAVDASFAVGGVQFQECCVDVRRSCRAASGPLANAVVHTEERFCPQVGRVRSDLRIEGGPEGLPSGREDTLRYYRIAGAPTPPVRPEGCEPVLLLPADVDAACGAGFRRPVSEGGDKDESGEDAASAARAGCVARFERGDAWIEVGSQRQNASDQAIEAAGRTVYLRRSEGACTAERLALLANLVESLLQ
ncbi:MAG: hypothetical protein AAF411_11865 [Myxococcota bacterium]